MNHSSIERKISNIVLIGMPGCGKSTVGRLLAKLNDMFFIDIDSEIVKLAGKSIPKIFAEDGEEQFRKLEVVATARAGAQKGAVIATGGGVVKIKKNYLPLAQNGRIYYIRRPLSELETEGRPLSTGPDALRKIYIERNPLYNEFSDCVLGEEMSLIKTVEYILNDFRSFNDKQ